MTRKLPDFLLVGAMKSGTTTLHDYLARHPEIFLCSPKEPGFFSREHVYSQGLDWYRGLFAAALEGQISGDCSTCYSRWPQFGDVAARVAKHLPDVRLVYIVRDPVLRSYSHYRHLMHERIGAGEPVLPLAQALEELPEIVDSSCYLLQIERFLEHFPRSRFHLLFLDELSADPRSALAALQEFLGVRPEDLTRGGSVSTNRVGTSLARRRMRSLIGRVRQAPVASVLIDLMPRRLRQLVRAKLMQPGVTSVFMGSGLRDVEHSLSPLDDGARRWLRERLAQPNRDLEAFLGRGLPSWSS